MRDRVRDKLLQFRDTDTADRDRTLQCCDVPGSEAIHTLTSVYKVYKGKQLSWLIICFHIWREMRDRR